MITCNIETKEGCTECAKLNDFPYEQCCLFECGEHEFCCGCKNMEPDKDDKKTVETLFQCQKVESKAINQVSVSEYIRNWVEEIKKMNDALTIADLCKVVYQPYK